MHAPSRNLTQPTEAPAVDLTPQLAERIGRAWGRAIGRTSYVPMTRRELHALLVGLAGRLLAAITATRPDLAAAESVGASLVDANFTDATALGRTLTVIGEQLATVLPGAQWRQRLASVQGSLAAGYASRLRERTLAEQDEIRTAAMMAHAEAEQARWTSEARFEAVFAEAAIGIGLARIDGRIIEVNRSLCEMFGYTRAEFCQRSVLEFMHPDDEPGIWAGYEALIGGERDHLRVEKPTRRRDGTVMRADMVASLVRDQAGAPALVVAMFEDVTERYELQRSLRHQALHDPLTGLPNRTHFFQRLDGVLADQVTDRRVGLCYLDIDEFDAVNDTLGHDVGDALLRTVAGRLTGSVEGAGALIARMGGDEFAILLADSTGERAEAVAAAVVAALRVPIDLDGRVIRATASVGVVERPVSGATSAELMKQVDTTLHWAKRDGRNRWASFDQARHAGEVTRYQLAAALPDALRDGNFFVEYQPLIRLDDGVMTGVEALVRWRHPQRGVLAPDQFIPLAEQTGHIVPLGDWVLAQACRQAVAWRAAYPDFPMLISVNLAERQIREDGVVRQVRDILTSTGLAPGELQLELTESAVMGSNGRHLATLRSLARMGVRIAIDDFGTGYSNLAYLRHLPVHCLKLAGPFVAGLRSIDDPDVAVDQEIVAALTHLAHTLHLTVTAEGVETPTQAERLRTLGCDTAQGWHYAAAGPPRSVEALFGVRLR